ncbi:MAG TPA: ABC transporter ATP-binding protein [Thermomicrobiales bacterium]|nr:ABC transporter ATP-binding protein [Thermomicrobiales bacterium]
MTMILAENLTRSYGNGHGVFDLSFSVNVGELFVFLGPNGAGKSSTVKMLTGLSTPDSGFASVAGYDSVRHRLLLKRSIGYVAERPHLDEKLTGREFVNFIADVFGVPTPVRDRRIVELFVAFELESIAHNVIETYSHGQRQKLALVAALVHEPAALFLDEPTNGLDPRSARIVKDVLRQICSRGATVFMTTHVLEIAEAMADRIAILRNGRLAALGSMEELQTRTGLPKASLEDVYLHLTGSAEAPVLSIYGPG